MLSQALQSAFQEFSNGSVSVSAVAFNSTALREQTVEFRGFFNLKYNTGDLRALDVDAATGVVDDAHPIWRAAPQLDTQTANNRVIVTYDRIADAGRPFRFAQSQRESEADSRSERAELAARRSQPEEPARYVSARGRSSKVCSATSCTRRRSSSAVRARIRRDQSPFPTTQLYSAFKDAQASREPLVYVAANDGMVHGFNAITGNERIGYVPNKLIDGSQRFKNDLDQLTSLTYSHQFFVDITPTVEDVFMPPNKGSVTKDWTTVLVGGLGGGGKGYYALNVSDAGDGLHVGSECEQHRTVGIHRPGRYVSGRRARHAPRWCRWRDRRSRRPADQGPRLHLQPCADRDDATSTTAVRPRRRSGSRSSATATTARPASRSCSWCRSRTVSTAGRPGDVNKVDTGEGVELPPDTLAGLPNGLGTPTLIDVDLNGTADIAYAGDLFGNLYRFDISNANPANCGR